MIHLGDITKISGYTAPIVDVVVGGSPCQDLSVAGKRAGLDGERSGLFMEQLRIIKEMRENDRRNGATDVRPRYMVWENVPGAFSSNKAEDFRIVLEETAKVKDPQCSIPMPDSGKWTTAGCILGDGWSIAWRVCDAQFYGVPQRRRRIALIADFGGHSAPEILFVRKSVSRDSEQSQPQRKETPSDASRGIGANDIFCIDGDKLNKKERAAFNQGQNALYDFEVSDKGINSPLVAKGPSAVAYPEVSDGIVGTLDAHYSNFPGCRGGVERTMVAAVDCRNCTENPDINGTLQAKETGGSSLNLNNVVRTKYIVRRLTPLECERLQGYPDNWTLIGAPIKKVVEDFDEDTGEKEGEHIETEFYYTNSQGKRVKCSDAQRYKALGNSIALPPWKWIMKRLSACYERDATLASLFDGIGGFPLIWEQINGKGSCLWAFEIEEFPIAVTKKRIGE